MDIKETGKKLKPFAPVLSVALVTACVAGSLSGYEAPVYAATQEETPVKKEETKEKKEEKKTAAKGTFDLEDGVYKGTGTGYAGDITVSVLIKDKQIVSIDILSSSDDAAFFTRAKAVIDKIIEGQMLDVDTVWNIWVIYLGFGAGLAVFMFCGFVKSIPVEIEEAAMIDGCNPLQTFFLIDIHILKPTMISVGILEAMWVWNDYLLPTLVLDIKKYKTIPMLIQYFRGSYGRVEMGPMMASIMLTVIPIIIVYLAGQKYIIKGVAAGAVKG